MALSRRDVINQRTMADQASVRHYAADTELTPPERAALDLLAGEVRGQPILDLGVGAGRTVPALVALSNDYVGIDLSPQMAEAASQRFVGVRIEVGDARDLRRFPDDHFQLVVFSCNGIGMVGHRDRLQILSEVRRVLRPGGAFVFSTHNRRSPGHHAGFAFPPFVFSPNPVRLAARGGRFLLSTVVRVRNRWRHLPEEERNAEYSIVNDVCHDYGTMLYYIDLSAQRAQLVSAGFRPDAQAFDRLGRAIVDDTSDSSILLLARK